MGMYWKKLAALLLAALLTVSCAAAEGALPLGGPAPYKPLPGAYSEDHRIYDDGSIRVEITVDEVWDTKV